MIEDHYALTRYWMEYHRHRAWRASRAYERHLMRFGPPRPFSAADLDAARSRRLWHLDQFLRIKRTLDLC